MSRFSVKFTIVSTDMVFPLCLRKCCQIQPIFQDDTQANLILEVIRNDPLRKMERQMKQEAERSILTAAKLISPVIENTFSAGYNW